MPREVRRPSTAARIAKLKKLHPRWSHEKCSTVAKQQMCSKISNSSRRSPMYKVAWGSKVSPEFIQKVCEICSGFNWNFDQVSHLMACMAFESDETFNPAIKNMAGSGATGLIQFMPSTAVGLHTNVEELANMTAVHQLNYVQAYFKPYAHKIRNLGDMYMAILLPKYIGAPDQTHLFNLGTVAYRQNSGLDTDSDGFVTKAEATAKVAVKLNKGLGAGYYGTLP